MTSLSVNLETIPSIFQCKNEIWSLLFRNINSLLISSLLLVSKFLSVTSDLSNTFELEFGAEGPEDDVEQLSLGDKDLTESLDSASLSL